MQTPLTIDEELKKVTAVTTLCHLCSLSQLEQMAAEARNRADQELTLKNEADEIQGNESDDN